MHALKVAAIGLAAAGVFAASAAAHQVPTTGARITLGNCVATPCESTYPANEPFFVRHGFVSDGTEGDLSVLLNPGTRFELTVDGQAVPSALDLELNASVPSKVYVTNFRFGMTGVHTLVGCWYVERTTLYCGTRTITFTS